MSTEIEHRTSAANCRLNPGVSASGNRCFVCERETAFIEAGPATPAPLDPSKVKAGDTVTLESGTALVRDVVIEAKSRGVGQFVFYTAENPDPLIPGTYYLVNSGAWTLAGHQPAPEPEPEWKPGTSGTATVREVKGVRGVWATLWGGEPYFVILEADKSGTGSLSSTAEHVTDFVPDETRPLPTREHLRNIVGVAHLGAGNGMVDRITDAVMSALGGAS